MKIAVLIVVSLYPCFAAIAQIKPIARVTRPTTASAVHRDLGFEQQVLERQAQQAALMRPEAKKKLSIAAHAVLSRLAAKPEESDVTAVTTEEVNRQFRGVAGPQSDLLNFYVLAEMSRILTNGKEGNDQMDNMNEMSEMSSLRLQMMMDRRSKFISTLSNLMKKISTTQNTLVQNMK